jgi:TonB family protein
MRSLKLFVVIAAVFAAFSPREAAAQPTPEESAPTPPSLETRADAAYPEAALRERLEGSVGLELVVAEDGTVADVKVTAPAGHGFDEAAAAAARRFRFEPARRNGTPIRSVVQFAYEFHLPPEAAPVTPPATAATTPPTPIVPPISLPAQSSPPPAEIEQRGADQSSLVLAQRPISAASSMTVRDREFRLRPVGSVADILRVTPGLLVVQHAGGGKANQYFLRGFDADHGTDVGLSIDGIPINMVSHAHGQGYSDTNFIIPELIDRVEITKGPYFAEQGDFATAGTINLVTKTEM